MSFSFCVREASKSAALMEVRNELREVIAKQPAHDTDAEAILETVKRYVDLVDEPVVGKVLVLSVAGSIWSHDDGIGGISINVNITFAEASAS